MQAIHVPRCGIVGSRHPMQVDAGTSVPSHDRVDDLVERCDSGTQRAPQRTGQPQGSTVVMGAHGHYQTSRYGQGADRGIEVEVQPDRREV